MNRLTISVFKAIAVSIIFIFLFDIVFYMYRVASLNSRMESISTSMRKVVMENNYLPPEVASNYSEIFKHMICDFNSVVYTPGMSNADLVGGGRNSQDVDGNNGNSVNAAAFIAGMQWNYENNAATPLSITANKSYWTGSGWGNRSEDIVKLRMKDPADYGDIMVMQMTVEVFQPLWGWTQADGTYNYNSGMSADDRSINGWVRNAAVTKLVYTYYVPCLNFRTITSTN